MPELSILVLIIVVAVVAYVAWRVWRKPGNEATLRELGRQFEDEARDAAHDVRDRVRDVRRGGGSGDDGGK